MNDYSPFRKELPSKFIGPLWHIAVDYERVRNIPGMRLFRFRVWVGDDTESHGSNVTDDHRKNSVSGLSLHIHPTHSVRRQDHLSVTGDPVWIPVQSCYGNPGLSGFLVSDRPVLMRDTRGISIQDLVIAYRAVVRFHDYNS